MPPDIAEALARAPRAYLIAAAGCGKTETIAVAAGRYGEGRQLVLTHTHAGVKALKDRLKKVGAPKSIQLRGGCLNANLDRESQTFGWPPPAESSATPGSVASPWAEATVT